MALPETKMNWNSQIKPPQDVPSISSASSAILQKNAPENPVITALKKWLKRLPFFMQMDFYRRRFLESSFFDFSIQPLADILADWPRVLVIDNTNSCNAKCIWCPNPELTNLGVMKMDVYRKIVDDYASRGGRVRFGTFGEPLLDKTFGEKIRHLRKHSSITEVEALTNAYFLNEKIVPILLENSVGVEISLDELDKENFEQVKKMSYDVVRKNIEEFMERNDRQAHPVPVNFRVKTLKTREETERHEFYKILASHDCTIELTPIDENIISNWAGKFDNIAFFNSRLGGSWKPDNFSYKQYNLSNPAPCVQLWKWIIVYWDGSVVLCCVDMFAATRLGSLREQSIGEIWRGPEMEKLRRQMISRGRFDIPICRGCDIHLGWNNLRKYYDKEGRVLPSRRFIS